MSREDAYRLVQSHAMQAWQAIDEPNAPTYRQRIEADPAITVLLSPEKIDAAFDVNRQLTNIDAVFARVLTEE